MSSHTISRPCRALSRPPRLSSQDADGNLKLTEHDPSALASFPQYAIIAHDGIAAELTYHDVVQGTGREKRGYARVQSSLEMARLDGLQHCWIASCCVNSQSIDERLTMATSFFEWFIRAGKCYLAISSFTKRETLIEQNASGLRSSGWSEFAIRRPNFVLYLPGDSVPEARDYCEQLKNSNAAALVRTRSIPAAYREGFHAILRFEKLRDKGLDITVCETKLDEFSLSKKQPSLSTAIDLLQDDQTLQTASRTRIHRARPISQTRSFSRLSTDNELDAPAQIGNEFETAADIGNPQSHAQSQPPWSTIAISAILQRPCHVYHRMPWSVVLMSFLTSVFYSALKGDAGAGFTIGAFLLAAGAMLVSEMKARHVKHCRCDETTEG